MPTHAQDCTVVDGAPFDTGPHFSAFLSGLFPRRFCMPCLAKVSEQPEQSIQEVLHGLTDRLESEVGDCRNCGETAQTYRMRETAG